jgi:hypothetical protein
MGKQSKGSRQERGDQPEQQAPERNRDWADQAAQARTADDPRAVAPHDAAGRPSTGNP